MSTKYMKMNVLGFGLGLGTAWALGIFLLSIMTWQLHMGKPLMEAYASLYVGYGAGFMGALWGALWGFADGFIGGVIISFVYNCVTPNSE